MSERSKLRQQLRDDGYCIVRGALASDAVDAHLDAYGRAAARHTGLDTGPLPADVESRQGLQVDVRGVPPRGLIRLRKLRQRFFERDTTHLALAFSPMLRDLAAAWFGREPVLVQAGTAWYSRGAHLHSDTLNANMTDPPQHMLRFWCALEDVDPCAGPLAVYPASHRLIVSTIREQVHRERPDLLAMHPRHLEPRTADNATQRFEDFSRLFRYALQRVAEQLRERDLRPVAPELRKGDVLVFDPSLMHESVASQEPQRTRKSSIFSMSPVDAVWYSPRVYWGALHDLRDPINVMQHVTEATPHGRRVRDYGSTCEAYERREIRVPVSAG